jgi:chromate transport protein ChrA
MAEPYSDAAKTVGDIVSLTTVVGTLMQILPSIAAIFTIVWTMIRIYETKTVQNFIKRWR